jgi:hypothetical protein
MTVTPKAWHNFSISTGGDGAPIASMSVPVRLEAGHRCARIIQNNKEEVSLAVNGIDECRMTAWKSGIPADG